LILSWALIPILLQLAFGADLLLANWRLALTGILPVTLYLWWVDSLAISAGTWMIDPRQTTGIMIGVLPIEEMVFFFLTNVIIVFGITLMLTPSGRRQLAGWIKFFRGKKYRFEA
jgi:lycopene cyclase domain-containing protein